MSRHFRTWQEKGLISPVPSLVRLRRRGGPFYKGSLILLSGFVGALRGGLKGRIIKIDVSVKSLYAFLRIHHVLYLREPLFDVDRKIKGKNFTRTFFLDV